MARLPCLLSLFCWLLLSTACGFVAVSGAIKPGNMQMASGVVTIVQFQFVNGSSSITVVTLAGDGTAQTLNFCGDQRTQFPMDRAVNASFMPGSGCNMLVTVTAN